MEGGPSLARTDFSSTLSDRRLENEVVLPRRAPFLGEILGLGWKFEGTKICGEINSIPVIGVVEILV